MLCWANENWTRAWDAGDHEVLLEQVYDPVEQVAHIAYLVDAFRDERYLRVDGRPVFAIYRDWGADGAGFIEDLRRAAAPVVGDVWVVKVDTPNRFEDPAAAGADAAAQFFPIGVHEAGLHERHLPLAPPNLVLSYDAVAEGLLAVPAPDWIRYECVTPGWDNTPRRGPGRSWLLHGSTPDGYERWLRAVVERAPSRTDGTPIVFVNAWNEWAEGAHLEPDLRWGRAYLRAHARATLGAEPAVPSAPPAGLLDDLPPPASVEARYEALYQRCIDLQHRLSALDLSAQRRLDHTVASLESELADEREVSRRLAAQLQRALDEGAADRTG
jgi:hypothetical protein